VRVEGQAEGEDEAVVTALPEGGPEAQLLYLHNGSPACVPVASLSLLFGQYGEPPHKPKPSADGSAAPAAAAARTPNHQAVVHALALINASVTRTAELMSRVDCKSGICRQQEGAGFLGEGGDLSALRDTSRESRCVKRLCLRRRARHSPATVSVLDPTATQWQPMFVAWQAGHGGGADSGGSGAGWLPA
jgi:hypothetical protein